jgi:hypothetical protein
MKKICLDTTQLLNSRSDEATHLPPGWLAGSAAGATERAFEQQRPSTAVNLSSEQKDESLQLLKYLIFIKYVI